MSQIMYNYPAMLALSAEMNGYAGALNTVGADIAAEQAALAGAWQGDTGMTYQACRPVEHQPGRVGPRLSGDGQHARDQHDRHERPGPGRRRQMGIDGCQCG
jgi:hypothetical protein